MFGFDVVTILYYIQFQNIFIYRSISLISILTLCFYPVNVPDCYFNRIYLNGDFIKSECFVQG